MNIYIVGKLSVLSIEDDIHSTNGFAITPDGILVLKLLEESFSCLGIEGKRTKIWNNDHYSNDFFSFFSPLKNLFSFEYFIFSDYIGFKQERNHLW